MNTSAAIREATANLTREHTEIAVLCNLAGFPELMADYIRRGLTPRQAKADLQRRRAEADEARQVGSLARGAFDPVAIERAVREGRPTLQ